MEEKIKEFTINKLSKINIKNTESNTNIFKEVVEMASSEHNLAMCLLGLMHSFGIGTENNLEKAYTIWKKILPTTGRFEIGSGISLTRNDDDNPIFKFTVQNYNPVWEILNGNLSIETYDKYIEMAKENFYMAISRTHYIPQLVYHIAMNTNDFDTKIKYLEIASNYNYEKAILNIVKLYENPPTETFESKGDFIKTCIQKKLENSKKAFQYLYENYKTFPKYNFEVCKFIFDHPELNYDHYAITLFYESKSGGFYPETYTLLSKYVANGRCQKKDPRRQYHLLTLGASKGDIEAYILLAQWTKVQLDEPDDKPNLFILCVPKLTYAMIESAKVKSSSLLMRAYRELLTFDKTKANETIELVKKIWPEFVMV